MRPILWVGALLGACEVTQVCHHLRFDSKLDISKTGQIDIIKRFASFCQHFVLVSPKKVEKYPFSFKIALPPATYDVIYRNHSNRSHQTCVV